MGGRHWSAEEEEYFWNTIIPRSPKRQGVRRNDPEMSWDELAAEMNRAFEGPNRRRVYTGQGIFEHWFLNVQKGNVSKNARRYVEPYVNQMIEEGATRTGLGFAKKQGPRRPRLALTKQTISQKKARLRPARRNTVGVPSNNTNETAKEARSSTSGAAENPAAVDDDVKDEYEDSDEDEDEDALFVGDGIPLEPRNPTPTVDAPVSQSHTSNNTGSAGTDANNARHQVQAPLASTDQVIQPTTQTGGNAPATTSIHVHHSMNTSCVSQTAQPISGLTGGAWDYSSYQNSTSAGELWDSQTPTYTGEPSDYLQGTFSGAPHTSQPMPSTERSVNSTIGVWDYENMTYTGEPSDYLPGSANFFGTSQQTALSVTPNIENGYSFTYGAIQSNTGNLDSGYGTISFHDGFSIAGGLGISSRDLSSSQLYGDIQLNSAQLGNDQRHNSYRDIGQRDDGQSGYGHRGYGQRDYSHRGNGQRDDGQRDYGQRGNGERDYGQRGYGQRDYSHRGNGQRDDGQRDYGQRGNGERDYGQRGNGERDYGHRGNGERDYGQRGYGERDYGQRDCGQRGYGQRDCGQRGNGEHDNGQRGYGQRDDGHRDYGQRDNGQHGYGQLHGNAYNTNGVYGGSVNAYGFYENTSIAGPSEQSIYPSSSGTHHHHDTFSGAAGNCNTATGFAPVEGNTTQDWEVDPASFVNGTDENSVDHPTATRHAPATNEVTRT